MKMVMTAQKVRLQKSRHLYGGEAPLGVGSHPFKGEREVADDRG